jgi:hypothetical protein
MITVQALQADGTWSVRNAFTTENARVISGSMSTAELEAKARNLMGQWQQTAPGKQLRVHNSTNDPTPAQRKRSDANVKAETAARALGWLTSRERHGDVVECYGVVHPSGHWAADWRSAVVFHDAMSAAAQAAA